MPSIDFSVHPCVLAALREDARAAASSTATEEEQSLSSSSPVAVWLVGLSLRDGDDGKSSAVTAFSTRVVGVVRCARSRPLSDDLAATTAMLPGGVFVVGAAAFAPLCSSPSPSPTPPPQKSLRSLAEAAASAARAAGGASAAEVAVAVGGSCDDDEGDGFFWLVGGEERRVAVAEDDAAATTSTAAAAAAAPATPPASPVVAALSSARCLDPWILERFSCVRCGPLEVSGGIEGARATLAELCGDGDDSGDAVFVVLGGSCSPSSSPISFSAGSAPILLAGDGPAPQSSSASFPLLVTPHSSPPPPPQQRQRSLSTLGPPPAPTAVFEPRRNTTTTTSTTAAGRNGVSSAPSSEVYAPPTLILDAVALYPKKATAAEAAAALRAALSRQLRAAVAAAAATATAATGKSATFPPPLPSLRASAFLLPGLPIYVTPLLPFTPRGNKSKKKKENREGNSSAAAAAAASAVASPASAAAARAALGKSLRLPPGLPLLRRSAALFVSNKKKTKKENISSRDETTTTTNNNNNNKKKRAKAVNSRSKLLDVHLRLPFSTTTPKPSSKTSSSSSSSSSPPPSLPPLPPSPTLACATVAGSYRYFHYGQDACDDRGWGCAYRSLQTLWSWFSENHFFSSSDDDDGDDGGDDDGVGDNKNNNKKTRLAPSFDPPSHVEVQRALVSLGDKPPSFSGSDQWIGAMEISYVLDALAGVECKVVAVPSGRAMASSSPSSAAAALVAHFREQGAPAMIGGGVLAYTCLGAAYDSATGEARFLILDPHYCGVSDGGGSGGSGGGGGGGRGGENAAAAAAAAVVKGGWVAWKKPADRAAAGGPLFVDDAFYNILLPQRPKDAV